MKKYKSLPPTWCPSDISTGYSLISGEISEQSLPKITPLHQAGGAHYLAYKCRKVLRLLIPVVNVKELISNYSCAKSMYPALNKCMKIALRGKKHRKS